MLEKYFSVLTSELILNQRFNRARAVAAERRPLLWALHWLRRLRREGKWDRVSRRRKA